MHTINECSHCFSSICKSFMVFLASYWTRKGKLLIDIFVTGILGGLVSITGETTFLREPFNFKLLPHIDITFYTSR